MVPDNGRLFYPLPASHPPLLTGVLLQRHTSPQASGVSNIFTLSNGHAVIAAYVTTGICSQQQLYTEQQARCYSGIRHHRRLQLATGLHLLTGVPLQRHKSPQVSAVSNRLTLVNRRPVIAPYVTTGVCKQQQLYIYRALTNGP